VKKTGGDFSDAVGPENPVLFPMNSKPVQMGIGPSHGNLEGEVENSDSAVAAN
jgi:hypothetical protein